MGIFVDLAKAFDTMDQSSLIDKLGRYGIGGVPLNLIKSFLKNRQQYVVVNGKATEIIKTNMGVPQGSILSPFLFFTFVNDLPSCLAQDSTLYANDSNIFMTAKK